MFGPVAVPNPRWRRCAARAKVPDIPSHGRLAAGADQSGPLYLETKWASLIPFAKVADLLQEVLPVGETTNHETVREHLQAVAERIEGELEKNRDPVSSRLQSAEPNKLPDGPMTVGIDGGYVRGAHKQGCFEVIAGRSVVAFRRAETDPVYTAECFGFVQTYDEKPRRRLWN